MPDTRRVMQQIDIDSVDLDLVETLLLSRSDSDAAIAYTMLRQVLPSRALVMLANLREIIAAMPDAPFLAGTGLDALSTAGGYECTGHSYRRVFESDAGVFGLEFMGGGTYCDGIVVHTATSRFALHGSQASVLDHEILKVLVHHETLLDSVLEALQILGYVLEPPIYVAPDDFVSEHGAAAAGQALSDLF